MKWIISAKLLNLISMVIFHNVLKKQKQSCKQKLDSNLTRVMVASRSELINNNFKINFFFSPGRFLTMLFYH